MKIDVYDNFFSKEIQKEMQTLCNTSHHNFCIANEQSQKWSNFEEVYLEKGEKHSNNFNGFFIQRSKPNIKVE